MCCSEPAPKTPSQNHQSIGQSKRVRRRRFLRRQELDSSLEEASALRERFRAAEARFNDASKDAAGVAETAREELMSEQRNAFAVREKELERRVEGLQEVRRGFLRFFRCLV